MIWVVASAAALSAALLLPARGRVAAEDPAEVAPKRADGAFLTRLRVILAPLAGLAAWTFRGGLVGLAAAALAVLVTWRVLGNVETPAAVRRRTRVEGELPAAVDLLVAAFEVGAAPGEALAVVGSALGGPMGEELSLPARQLRLGVDPGAVWAQLGGHPQLGSLGRALLRAHDSGASITDAGRRLADDVRSRQGAEAQARAKSVSTKAAAPLGLCLLPAFVLLGVVPLVAGLLSALRFG